MISKTKSLALKNVNEVETLIGVEIQCPGDFDCFVGG
jgi:hypothetical protein